MSRLRRHGFTVPVVVFHCPRCHRRINAARPEAQQPCPNAVAYCADCMLQGHNVVMRRKEYRSGPTDLFV